MASTYVNDLRLNEMATGDASGSWGTVTNTNLELIGEAFSYGTETIGDADSTLTIADGAADAARSFYLKITSSVDLTTTRIVTLGPNTVSKVWMIENATTGSQVITIKQGSGATINVPNGQVKMISTDGAGSGGAVLDLLVDVDLTGTTTLVNLDVSGTLGVTGVLTATSLDISGDIDVDGTTNLDVVDIDGAVDMASTLLVTGVLTTTDATVSNGGGQFNGAINVGVDDTGYDVKFFGATAGKYMLWDESADTLEVSGTVVAAAGTALLPSITTTGDLNTGMWFPAADTIAFSEGGVEALRIDSSGNVGIGTSSPDALLDVSRSGNGQIAVLQTNANRGFSFESQSDTALQIASVQGSTNLDLWANTLTFSAGATERMRIDSSGNVIIGSGGLDVSGIGGTYQALNMRAGSGYAALYGQTTNTTTNSAAMQVIGATSGASAGGGAELLGVIQIAAESDSSTNATGYINFFTGSGGSVTEKMRIDSSGNVGIGTSSPAHKLTVAWLFQCGCR
jgi:hypothetical protein